MRPGKAVDFIKKYDRASEKQEKAISQHFDRFKSSLRTFLWTADSLSPLRTTNKLHSQSRLTRSLP